MCSVQHIMQNEPNKSRQTLWILCDTFRRADVIFLNIFKLSIQNVPMTVYTLRTLRSAVLTCRWTASDARTQCTRNPRRAGARADWGWSCWSPCSSCRALFRHNKNGGQRLCSQSGAILRHPLRRTLTVLEVELVEVHALHQIAERLRLERG